MKIFKPIFALILLSASVNVYSQTNDQTTLSGFWSMFKSAILNEDFSALENLSRLPLIQVYYDNVRKSDNLKEYFQGGSNGDEFNLLKSQIKNIEIPKKFEFYDKDSEKRFCNNFKIKFGSEVYSAGIEGFYWSFSDLIFVKINGKYYFLGDDSIEYEG